ncbi:hypothetical protein [Actinoplanes italicus]|uniref:hypothetical protein n=1 Tax=Actinoplanes italicus TaxID=113567 RepID=UPI000D058D05|nr:hypothetical protein [Actinoplanes italicus]
MQRSKIHWSATVTNPVPPAEQPSYGGYPPPGQPAGEHPSSAPPSGGYPAPGQFGHGYPAPGQPAGGYPAPGQAAGGYPPAGQFGGGYPPAGQFGGGYPPAGQPGGYPPPQGYPGQTHPGQYAPQPAPQILIQNSTSAAAFAGGYAVRKRQSFGLHVVLFLLTGGLGNIVYAWYVIDWNRKRGL